MGIIIQIVIFLSLLALGFFFGRLAESRHYRRIQKREQEYRDVFLSSERFPSVAYVNHGSVLVSGSVVISIDYFKLVMAGLKQIVGGRLTSYESLLDRARREAILRMQEQAKAAGAEAVINLKFETSRISGSTNNSVGSMEVLAYGTALVPQPREY